MGVSAAMWAAVVLAPTDLAREGRPFDPDEDAAAPAPPVPEPYLELEARLAEGAPAIEPELRQQLAAAIVVEAQAAQLDPLLILAVIEVESRFDEVATSGAGALGLMQLREPTLRRELERQGLSGDPFDPVVNVQAGVRYLRRLLDAFPREDLALMAYNAGPNRILAFLREGQIPERFHRYPRRVKAALRRLHEREPTAAARILAEQRAAPAPLPSRG
ncbi:MAG TPA: lytic transglycosylase domain-containing protein [Anaeromyxobacter sp.]|nr:lytic transglycosylase domain-containing protein [Anaeromyxobacter sp.]